MKSLQIVKLYAPVIGGVEKIAEDVAEGLGSDVLCCQKKGKRSVEEIKGVKVIKTASFGMYFAMPVSLDFIRVWRKINRNYDVIDLHTPFPLADLALFIFRPKAKLIVHYHSDIVRQKLLSVLLQPIVRSTLRRADKIIVSSPNLKNSSLVLRKFQNKIEVVPFGLDLAQYEKFDANFVTELKNKYGKFALYIGRFSYYKGLTYLVKAMQKVDYKLIMIGDGNERFRIEKLIFDLGLAQKITLLPFQTDEKLRDYFHASSVFVLPSIYKSEAFGIVLMEALACSTPLVSTELETGTSFVNQHKKTGLVVKKADDLQLAEAINRILSDNPLQAKYSKSALERAKSVFDLKIMLDKIQKSYKM